MVDKKISALDPLLNDDALITDNVLVTRDGIVSKKMSFEEVDKRYSGKTDFDTHEADKTAHEMRGSKAVLVAWAIGKLNGSEAFATDEDKKYYVKDDLLVDFTPDDAVDSVNGQTGIVVLNTANVPDASNTRYVTDAEKVDIGTITDKVASVTAGTNIVVDNSDPQNPIVSSSGGGAVDSVNGQTGVVVLDTGDIAEAADKNYVTDNDLLEIADISNKLDSVVAGDNVSVDVTDPNNPIVSSSQTFDTVKYDPANMIGDVVHMNTLQKVYSHMYSSGVGLDCNITDNGDGSVDLSAGTVTIRPTATGHNNIFHALIPESLGVVLTDDATNYVYVDYNSGTPIWAVTLTESVTNGQDKVLAFIVARQAITLKIINVRDTGVDFANKANTLFKGFSRFMHKQGGSKVGSTGLNLTCTSGIFYFGVNSIPHDSFDTSVAGTANLNTFKYIYTGWNYVSDVKLIDNVNYDNAGTLTPVPLLYWKVDWVYMINGDTSSLAVVYGTEIYTNKSKARKGTPPSSIPSQLSGVGVLIGRVILKRDSTSMITESTFDTVFVASEVTEHNDLSGLQGGAVADYQHLTSAQHTIATQPASATLDGYVSTASQEFAGDKTIIDGNGTNVIRKENNIRYMEDFLKDAPADVTTTTGLTSSVLLSIDRAFDGKYRDLSYTIGLTDTNGTIDFDSIPISGHIDNELLGLHINYGYNGDAKDWSYIVQESSDNITFTDASSESLSKGEASKAFLNKILFTLKTTSTHYRLRAKCLVENLSKVLRIQNYFVITDPMPTAQFVEVNSISLSGNDAREVSANIESVPFGLSTDTRTGWTHGVDGSTTTNGNYYTVQNSNRFISISAAVDYITGTSLSAYLYKNGVQYKKVGLTTSLSDIYIHYNSYEGEFEEDDKLAFTLSAGVALGNNADSHYLNIVESSSSSNVVFEGVEDQGQYENHFSIKIGSTGNGQDDHFGILGGANVKTSTGNYTINYPAGFFGGVTPNVTFQAKGNTGATAYNPVVGIVSESDTQIVYIIRENAASVNNVDSDHIVKISRGDGDYRSQVDRTYSVTPASVEPTVTKVLSADVQSDGILTELTMDTIVGEEYGLAGQLSFNLASDNGVTVIIESGTQKVYGANANPNAGSGVAVASFNPASTFTATATTLTFTLSSADATSYILGDGERGLGSTFTQLTHRNRKGVPLVEVARTAHISGGVEYPTADTFDGKVIYARSYVVTTDITTGITIDVIDAGLTIIGAHKISANIFTLAEPSPIFPDFPTDYAYFRYGDSTGTISTVVAGRTVYAGTNFTMRYTKP